VNSIRSDPRYISVRNLKSVNWISFQNNLLQYEFQPELNQDLADTEFWKLNNFVLHELDKVAPIGRKRVKGLVNPWFTHEVRSMCHDRDAAKKIALRTQSVNDWKIYRRKRNAATDFISKSKKNTFCPSFKKNLIPNLYGIQSMNSLDFERSLPLPFLFLRIRIQLLGTNPVFMTC
jgi:hypothetical protein